MKKTITPLILVIVSLSFFWKYFGFGLIPVPADTLVGLYHPFRDTIVEEYPNGIAYKNYLITDPIRQQYPWRYLAIESLSNGELPSWNPYSFSGMPLAGNLQSAAFYPLNILFFIMPFVTAWNALVILQPILAGLFMYFFLRKRNLSPLSCLFGGFTYGFSGVSIAWLEWNTIGHIYLWLPFVLYVKDYISGELIKTRLDIKKTTVLFLLIFIAEVSYWFAGHFQVAFYVWIVTYIYLIWLLFQIKSNKLLSMKLILKRYLKFYGLLSSFILLITSIQWIPFIKFVLSSSRAVDQVNWHKEGWFMPVQHLVQFIAPDFFGNPATLNYWGTWNYAELVGYIGVFPLLFAFFGFTISRNSLAKLMSMLLAGSMIFVVSNPIAWIPYQLSLPFISSAQPTRLLIVAVFSLVVLSAIGFDRFQKHIFSVKRTLGIFGTLLVLMVCLWLFVSVSSAVLTDYLDVSKRNLILPSVFIFLFISLFFMHRYLMNSKTGANFVKIIPLIIISVTVIDLFRFGWKFTPFVNQQYLYPESPVLSYLQKQEGEFRIMTTDDRILPPNVSIMYGLQSVEGYDPLYSTDYANLISAWVRNRPDESPLSFNRIITPHDYSNPIARLLNVMYVLTFDTISEDGYELVFQEGLTKLYKNYHAFPRAYFAEKVIKVSSLQEATEELLYNNTNKHIAVVYDNLSIETDVDRSNDSVVISYYSPNTIKIKTTSDHENLLVLADAFYPTWKAQIDGVDKPIIRTNIALRGIVVPAGNHQVQFINSLW